MDGCPVQRKPAQAGIHASAILKEPETYEHVPPESVGNQRRLLVSKQAGRSNVLASLESLGLATDKDDPRVQSLLDEVKSRESGGYAYESAEASFELLARRHLATLWQGWTLLLLLLGVTILVGCVVCNRVLFKWPEEQHWWGLLLVKGVQVGVMLGLVVRLRPQPADQSASTPALTAAERQIWSLVPGYYGSFLALLLLNRFLGAGVPLAPVLSVLSGMGFATLGATIWGWAYGWAVAFMLLAPAAAV